MYVLQKLSRFSEDTQQTLSKLSEATLKEVKIVYRFFLVNCYLLHVPRLPSQPASTGWRLSDWLNWLELAWQYIVMTRNNLSNIWISLATLCNHSKREMWCNLNSRGNFWAFFIIFIVQLSGNVFTTFFSDALYTFYRCLYFQYT